MSSSEATRSASDVPSTSTQDRALDGDLSASNGGAVDPPSEEGEIDDLIRETAQAGLILRANCAARHGIPDEGGLSQIDNTDALIEMGYLVPCNAAGSPIVQRIVDGSMPPDRSLSPNDVQTLVDSSDL
jgi:hypothetical protein